MAEERDRRRVFGEVVEAYEAARPGYPDALVTDVLRYAAGPAGSGPGTGLEVGAGTGKATVSFAARGLDLTCVEPDPRMAAALTRNLRAHPRVTVELAQFENWPVPRRFDLLYSAQAWHWVEPDRRCDLAHAALVPGGAVALFWNGHAAVDPALHEELVAVDDRYGFPRDRTPHARVADRLTDGIDPIEYWPSEEMDADARFTDTVECRYRGEPRRIPTARYLDLLTSLSLYRLLDDDRRAEALAEVARAVDSRGGTIELVTVTDLYLTRTA